MKPAILPGLPGGPPYESRADFEARAWEFWSAIASLRPAMVQREIEVARLGLNPEPPR